MMMKNNKHAYLIMAHNEFEVLEKLLRLLDNERNDIYIHIDKKVKNFNFLYYKSIIKKSEIHFVKRINVKWGDFSQIKCEMILLKEAVKKNYLYYHLLSGVDLPIKTQSEIHQFFDNNLGYEYIHYCSREQTEKVKERITKFHFTLFQKNKNKYISFFGQKLELILLKGQQICHFERKIIKQIKLGYGSQWFSITNDLAKYIVSKEKWIKKIFRYSFCSDELVVQTIVLNSKFKKKLYYKGYDDNYIASKRFIDWERGSPYVFTNDDFETLISSEFFFARKFSIKKDEKVITNIYEYLVKIM